MSANGGRVAAKVSIERLHNVILGKIGGEVTLQQIVNPIPSFSTGEILEKYSKVEKDLRKIVFDFENETMNPECPFGRPKQIGVCLNGYHTLDNGFTFLGVQAGGDWEEPLFFIIYFDGKDLRGYIPEDGNVYNKLTKTAFGSEGETRKDSCTDVDIKKIIAMFPDINEEEIRDAAKKYKGHFGQLCDHINDYWTDSLTFNWDKIEEDIKSRIQVI